MTARAETLAAIEGGARTVADIVEATGLAKQNVYQAISELKKDGAVEKGDDGYELSGSSGEIKPRVHEAGEASADPPPVARTKRKYTKRATKARKVPKVKRTPKKRAAKQAAPQSNGHAANGSAVEFAKFGDYVVLKRTDVVDLLRTMQRWSDMVERML